MGVSQHLGNQEQGPAAGSVILLHISSCSVFLRKPYLVVRWHKNLDFQLHKRLGLNFVFNGAPDDDVTPLTAVQQLKQQRDKLKQYQKRITLNLERERDVARQLLRDGKKAKALLLLKKKRYQEQLLDKTENQISNLERMVQDIEFTQIEMKVIEGLKIGNECLHKMHEVMSVEEVERIIDETQDAVEYQRQIDEMLAGSLTEEDEDAILEELNAITQVSLNFMLW
nr:charged multivesicular body protein 6 [Pelodiscus sinensis]|eukprot:XP_025038525.1 charged multivesicular body protein 6 [Pelodiscus sinensis]